MQYLLHYCQYIPYDVSPASSFKMNIDLQTVNPVSCPNKPTVNQPALQLIFLLVCALIIIFSWAVSQDTAPLWSLFCPVCDLSNNCIHLFSIYTVELLDVISEEGLQIQSAFGVQSFLEIRFRASSEHQLPPEPAVTSRRVFMVSMVRIEVLETYNQMVARCLGGHWSIDCSPGTRCDKHYVQSPRSCALLRHRSYFALCFQFSAPWSRYCEHISQDSHQ